MLRDWMIMVEKELSGDSSNENILWYVEDGIDIGIGSGMLLSLHINMMTHIMVAQTWSLEKIS